MPQITLECTNNVLEKNNLSQLVLEINHVLSERLPTELASCKARILFIDNFVVGDNDKQNAFVHLSISVLKGRSTSLLDEIAAVIMQNLKAHFSSSLSKLNLQITIAIQDLPDVYHKLKQ